MSKLNTKATNTSSFQSRMQEIKEFESKLQALKQMKEDVKEDANREISRKLSEINTLFSECELIAKTAGVEFNYDGPSYGMGGYFDGNEWSSSSNNC